MIVTVILVSLAYYWLMLETNWLRVNLMGTRPDLEFDCDLLAVDDDLNFYQSEEYADICDSDWEFIKAEQDRIGYESMGGWFGRNIGNKVKTPRMAQDKEERWYHEARVKLLMAGLPGHRLTMKQTLERNRLQGV